MNARPSGFQLAVFGASLAAVAASIAQAASPNLGSMAPYGGQRGTEVEVIFSGERMADAEHGRPPGPPRLLALIRETAFHRARADRSYKR